MAEQKSSGMKWFMIIWVGQFISILGSAMTGLGLPIWVYNQTHRATDLTVMAALWTASLLIASPLTGVLVDRHNKKLMMMLSDLAAGLVTIFILVMFSLGKLQIWHLYITSVVEGAFNSFQWPAFSAAVSVMVSKDQYTRTATLMDLSGNSSAILAPLVAGAILGFMGDTRGFETILLIDIITFMVAVGSLLFVPVPEPERSQEQEEAEKAGFLSEVTFGFKYVFKRPSLLGLQSIFMIGNFFATISMGLFAPMILARTNSNELMFGTLQSIGAVGAVIGGVVISAWGGFKKRKVNGVLLGWMVTGLTGAFAMGLGRPDIALLALPMWGLGRFFSGFWVPLINGSNQAIWQAKVPPDIQGKVFSVRRLIAWIVVPLAGFVSGPLADLFLEPAMANNAAWTRPFQHIVGSGPGAGMSLTFLFTGVIMAVVGLSGYFVPVIRNAETLLPDHDAVGNMAAAPVVEAAPAEA